MRTRITITVFCGLMMSAMPSTGQEGEQASRIVDRVIAGEQAFLGQMKQVQPFLETYIQEFGDVGPNGPVLVKDHYMLGRMDMTKGVNQNGLAMSAGFHKRSRSRDNITFLPAGWAQIAQMVFPDAYQFDRAVYDFEYSRKEFLGDVRCLVFEVAPRTKRPRANSSARSGWKTRISGSCASTGLTRGASRRGCSSISTPGG